MNNSDHDEEDIGIQAAMRASWVGEDVYEQLKRRRRAGRHVLEWEGKRFWLTNKTRRYAKNIAGCWLFGHAHVDDLVEEICGELGIELARPLRHQVETQSKAVAVQMAMFDD